MLKGNNTLLGCKLGSHTKLLNDIEIVAGLNARNVKISL